MPSAEIEKKIAQLADLREQITVLEEQQEKTKMPRGRRVKVTKQPTRLERLEKLRDRIVNLKSELLEKGFGGLLPPPGPIQRMEEPDVDPKTGGSIAKVKERLGVYIQRVSVEDNFSQRPPFDHVNDPIYRRLIRDFLAGAIIPESKVAALARDTANRRAKSVDDASTLVFSVIDGLQRLYCCCIAILLILEREKLVADGLLTRDAWEYFRETVEKAGDTDGGTKSLLTRSIRYELFYDIDLAGLLHYMVTFNTGQRRMSLPVQLEIMQRTLIDELEQEAKIAVWRDLQKMPGMSKPKEKFSASDLVLATRAFIANNPQVSATEEAEDALEKQAYLDQIGDINDVVSTLRRIGTQIHPEVMRVYAEDANRRYMMSGGLFLLGLCAACGYVRNRNNMKMLDGALDKLVQILKRPIEDPLKLDEYQDALSMITASRGKAIRRLVYDTFLRFFSGATTELEWKDTAQQITGSIT